MSWTILTCELPPSPGGVGHYTAQVAAALAAEGDSVAVACPPQAGTPVAPRGVELLPLSDAYGRGARAALDRRLDRVRSTVLVQYVPTAFGMGGANIPFCRWLLGRARQGADVRMMFHEPYFEFGWTPLHQSALSVAQRAMAKILLRASRQTYVSTDSWRRYLAPYVAAGARADFVTLPIPSAIPASSCPSRTREHRQLFAGSRTGAVLGHFGTYGSHIAPMVLPALAALLSDDGERSAVCVGAGSTGFVRALTSAAPALAGRVHAADRVEAAEVAAALSACDLLLQPYPDGVTTRRTSTMAGLINARPVLTTAGHLTEPVWAETRAVTMSPAGEPQAYADCARRLLAGTAERDALAARGERTYRERFALEHTIGALRRATVPVSA
jgi:glycosyltransferase involved in cell wall biosynthesis